MTRMYSDVGTLTITVRGRSAHGAYPDTGIDAVLIAVGLALGAWMYRLPSR